MKKFFQWGYVKRHFASKGIADIVCVRPHPQGYRITGPCAEVVFIQCKFGAYPQRNFPTNKREELIKYSQDCGAIPIFAYNQQKKIKLVDLNINKEFVP